MPAPVSIPFDSSSRRLAVYGYLAPLLAGRRVLEIGAGAGAGAVRLHGLGAAEVVGVDADARAITRARAAAAGTPGDAVTFRVLERRTFEEVGEFDLVVLPDGAELLGPGASLTPATLQRLCGPGGQVALLVQSADHAGDVAPAGAGYYEVVAALQGAFPSVRMFGVTPFAAFGLTEFAETPAGLRIDGGLVEEAGEQPTHYLAVAGPEDDFDLGYALMQVAAVTDQASQAELAVAGGVGASAASAASDPELRRRLAEAEGKCEGLLRVSRAQTEEIEELRARLRRGAESREELDQEMGRLRRALAEADASVLDLTRRTTQEMASLAQRITAGLRPEAAPAEARGDGVPVARLREELRRREEELAAAESALSERDERVAALEAEKQDLDWRLAAALAAPARAVTSREAVGRGPSDDGAAQRQRELALEQYRQAAAAHLDEVGRLREALAEQSTLVAELEESLSASGRRLAAALDETERLRRHTAEIEEGDRARRSRLAEVEGTLLRLQRQTAMAARADNGHADNGHAGAASNPALLAEWERRLAAAHDDGERRVELVQRQAQGAIAESEAKVAALTEKLAALASQLREADGQRDEAERRWADAVERTVGLERALVQNAADRGAGDALPASEPAPEFADEALAFDRAPLGIADGPRLEAAMREVSRLREILERSEEQLWETKGQLLLDRERMAVLEHQLAEGPSEPIMTEAAHQSIMNAVYKELAALEYGVRAEIARLERIEKTVDGWRAPDVDEGGEDDGEASSAEGGVR